MLVIYADFSHNVDVQAITDITNLISRLRADSVYIFSKVFLSRYDTALTLSIGSR